MPGQLRHLGSGHRTHAVATVVEDEPFLAGDAVAAKTQANLRRERLEHLAVAHRRRGAEHERPRAGNMAARVRVRPAHVAEHEVLRAELALEPVDVHDGGQLRHDRGTPSGSR